MKLIYLYVGFLLLFVGGWIANIVKLISYWDVESGMSIMRIIGVFIAPIGGVLGFL